MKALKEKRISLRSLWRMGLVVLSIFALALVACGDSDSGNNTTGPGAGVVTPSGRELVSITINKMPLEITDGVGYVNEGQPIVLAGIELNVRYAGSSEVVVVRDTRNMSITPAVYLWPFPGPIMPGAAAAGAAAYNPIQDTGFVVNPDTGTGVGYLLTYYEGNRSQSVWIDATFPGRGTNFVRRLLDIDVTGQFAKQSFLIDEEPELMYNGITVNGVYSQTNQENPSQSNYYREPIPLTTAEPEYKWAWVWNKSIGVGTFQPQDQPGVLISIGAYGQIRSEINGTVRPGLRDTLFGKRVEVSQIHNVDRIAFASPPTYPNKVFYDDPTLIGAAYDWDKWIDTVYQGAMMAVTYTNDETRTYSLRQLAELNYFYIDNVGIGWGGNWGRLDFYPISRTGKRIDTRLDTTAHPAVTDGSWVQTTVTFPPVGGTARTYNYTVGTAAQGYDGDAAEIPDANVNSPTYGISFSTGGAWAEWAALGATWTRMQFNWRGKTVNEVVPVYNRPESLRVSVRAGGNSVVMTGYNQVHREPEGRNAFLSRLKVSVTYSRQGGDANDRATRDDVYADILAGTAREFIPYTSSASGNLAARRPAVTPGTGNDGTGTTYAPVPGGAFIKDIPYGTNGVTNAALATTWNGGSVTDMVLNAFVSDGATNANIGVGANQVTGIATLWSAGIWNWTDNEVGGDLRSEVARRNQLNDVRVAGTLIEPVFSSANEAPAAGTPGSYTAISGVASLSQLNATNTAQYRDRNRPQNARVFYTGFGGNPWNTRDVRNNDDAITVGVTGYPEDIPIWDDGLFSNGDPVNPQNLRLPLFGGW